MAFVRGLMGLYMRPISGGASAAMLFSLMVAFVVSLGRVTPAPQLCRRLRPLAPRN